MWAGGKYRTRPPVDDRRGRGGTARHGAGRGIFGMEYKLPMSAPDRFRHWSSRLRRTRRCHEYQMNRREFMAGIGGAGLDCVHRRACARPLPPPPWRVARCRSYGPEYLAATGKDVRPTGRARAPGQGQNGHHQNQSDRQREHAAGPPARRPHDLDQSAYGRRRHPPAGQSRCAAHPRGGGSLGMAGRLRSKSSCTRPAGTRSC